MSLLFTRAWTLDIVAPGKTKGARYGTEGVNPSELHMTFDIERTLASTSNKGKFVLYNLAPDNSSNIAQGAVVILRAGYSGNLGIVFQGVVRKTEVTQNANNVTTSIECGDGDPFITYGHLSKTYKGTVSLAQVLLDISERLNVELGGQVYKTTGNIVQGIPDKSYSRLVLHGKVKSALDRLLHPLGMAWSIQCGVLLIQNQKGLLRLRATVLSPETGLVETPSRTNTGVKCKSLLNPRIVPGSAIQIAAANPAVNGNFRCIRCAYKGDTTGADWTVEVDGQGILGPLAPVPIPVTQSTTSFQDGIFNDPEEPEEVL